MCREVTEASVLDWKKRARRFLGGSSARHAQEVTPTMVQETLAASQDDRRKACAANAGLANVLIDLRRQLESSEAATSPTSVADNFALPALPPRAHGVARGRGDLVPEAALHNAATRSLSADSVQQALEAIKEELSV